MILTENYSIEFDENNAILVFKETKTKKKEGIDVEYVSTDRYFYPNLKTCLCAFVQKDLHGSTSIFNVITRIDELEKIILNLK